jgi:hypothetical protein
MADPRGRDGTGRSARSRRSAGPPSTASRRCAPPSVPRRAPSPRAGARPAPARASVRVLEDGLNGIQPPPQSVGLRSAVRKQPQEGAGILMGLDVLVSCGPSPRRGRRSRRPSRSLAPGRLPRARGGDQRPLRVASPSALSSAASARPAPGAPLERTIIPSSFRVSPSASNLACSMSRPSRTLTSSARNPTGQPFKTNPLPRPNLVCNRMSQAC